ncbi:MAG: winged helix-turn-helix transcriptional regulator [Methanobacteriota archaeon]
MKLDPLDTKILLELLRDARLSFRELSRRVGSSTPTVSARVKALEEIGVIRGYHADVAWADGRRKKVDVSGRQTVDVACHQCKGPIHEAVRAKIGGRAHVFCCGQCRDAFGERFRRLNVGGRASRRGGSGKATPCGSGPLCGRERASRRRSLPAPQRPLPSRTFQTLPYQPIQRAREQRRGRWGTFMGKQANGSFEVDVPYLPRDAKSAR